MESQRHRDRRLWCCCCITSFAFSHHGQSLIRKALLSRFFCVSTDVHAFNRMVIWRWRIYYHRWDRGSRLLLLLLLLLQTFSFLLLLLLLLILQLHCRLMLLR